MVIKKRADEIGTPSILQALAGKTATEKQPEPTKPELISHVSEKSIDLPFNLEKIHAIWPEFAKNYTDQVHLYNTLLSLPVLELPNTVVISVENSVQQDKIRLMKHEIIGFLRRNLQNSTIDVRVDLIKNENETKILTDEQKIKAMIQKNPALGLLKNKFNLDFNG